MFFSKDEERELLAFLKSLTIFKSTATWRLKRLASKVTYHSMCRGDYLLKPGEQDETIYLIFYGRLKVYDLNEQAPFHSYELGHGQFVGGYSLLTDLPHATNVLAIRDSMLLKFPKTVFLNYLQRSNEHTLTFVRDALVNLRPRVTTKDRLHTICLVSAGDSRELKLFSHAFIKALDNQSVLYLTQHTIKQHLQKAGIDSRHLHSQALIKWLNDQENHYQYVLYETTTEINEWNMLCLRQADKVLLIANEPKPSSLNPLETFLFDTLECESELIILQPQTKVVTFSAQPWLNKRAVKASHHVCLNDPSSIRRFIRYLKNETLALVLGGGGARGLCHIGAYKALYEHEIPIDCVGGTSSGALIGALIAMDYTPEQIIELVETYIVNNKKLFSYTLPLYSFSSGKALKRMLQTLYQDTLLTEDLWLRFFCVSTNLTQLSTQLHTQGVLWKNIRASISLPGIFPPISNENEELLIDGAITNNLPVDLMRPFSNKGKVISIKVSGVARPNSGITPDGWLSPWQGIKYKFKQQPLPTLTEIMMESTMLAGSRHQREMGDLSDLHIDCPTKAFNPLDFKPMKQLIELGYRTTIEALEKYNI